MEASRLALVFLAFSYNRSKREAPPPLPLPLPLPPRLLAVLPAPRVLLLTLVLGENVHPTGLLRLACFCLANFFCPCWYNKSKRDEEEEEEEEVGVVDAVGEVFGFKFVKQSMLRVLACLVGVVFVFICGVFFFFCFVEDDRRFRLLVPLLGGGVVVAGAKAASFASKEERSIAVTLLCCSEIVVLWSWSCQLQRVLIVG